MTITTALTFSVVREGVHKTHQGAHATEFSTVAPNIFGRIIAALSPCKEKMFRFTCTEQKAPDNRFKGHHRTVGPQYVLASSRSIAPRIWRWLPVRLQKLMHTFSCYSHTAFVRFLWSLIFSAKDTWICGSSSTDDIFWNRCWPDCLLSTFPHIVCMMRITRSCENYKRWW
jgi:hypothetical protein